MTQAIFISATLDPELMRRDMIETTWASRLVYADALNADRFQAWQMRRAFLSECHLPASAVTRVEAAVNSVTPMPKRKRA